MTVRQRYLRNLEALSEEECALLATRRIGVFGCGGLGGSAIEALARIGVGELRVVDGDAFEEHNLNRQLLATAQSIGREKALVAAERIAEVNDLVAVDARVAFLDETNAAELLSGLDCAVDCLDSLESRLCLGRACQQAGIPLVYGAIAGWFGQVCTVYPGDASFSEVYGSAEGSSQHLKLGNLPFTAHCVAAVQAAEAVKAVLGHGEPIRNRLLALDLLDGSAEELPLG